MKRHRSIVMSMLAVATGLLVAPADAAPAGTPFAPMVIIQVDGVTFQGPEGPKPRFTIPVQAPAGWSCFDSWNPQTFDYTATCVPPAAPPGMANYCGWVVSLASLPTQGPPGSAPLTTAACGGASASSGGPEGAAAAVAVANQNLSALQCRLNLRNVPPGIPFQSRCTTNH